MVRIDVRRKVLDQELSFHYEIGPEHGIFLSGGLDSLSLLNWISIDAPDLIKQLTAFTIKKENWNCAKKIVDKYGIKKHEFVEAQAQQGEAARLIKVTNPQIKYFYAGVTANPQESLKFQGPEASRGNRPGVRLQMPFVDLDKRYSVQLALDLNAPIEMSHTCTTLEEGHCGQCFMCTERRWAFSKLNIPDPTIYAGDRL